MKNLTCILILGFLSQFAFGQSQPLKGKGQAQSTYQTIERLQTQNNSLTVTADKAILLEDQSNLLVNPGFEHQTFSTGWTVNNGTASADAVNFFGTAGRSMSIALTAVNGDILTQCVTPAGQMSGTSMLHSMRVKTTLTNLQVCSVQGSTEQQCSNVSSTDTWALTQAGSVAGSGAQCVKLKSTSAATGTVKIDATRLEENKTLNLTTIKPAIRLLWTGSQTAFHDVDVEFIFPLGTLTQTLDGFTHNGAGVFTSQLTQECQITARARQLNVVDAALMRQAIVKIYKNGAFTGERSGEIPGLAGNNINSGGNGGALPDVLFTGKISFVPNDTFQVYYYQANGSGLNRTTERLKLEVDCFTGQTVTPVQNTTWWAQGSLSGANYSMSLTNTGGYVDFSNAGETLTPVAGSQPMGTLCVANNPTAPSTAATVCAAGNEAAGFNVNIPEPGFYTACAEFQPYGDNTSGLGLAFGLLFKLVETNLNNTTILQDKTNATSSYSAGGIGGVQPQYSTTLNYCRVYNFTTIGQKAIRLLYSNGGTSIAANSLILADNLRSIMFTIVKGAYVNPMPIIANSITSNSPAAYRQEFAYIVNSGSCAVSTQSSNWITSTTDPGVGQCGMVWPASTWSAPPWCVTTANANGAGWCAFLGITTLTGVTTLCQTPAGGGTSSDSPYWIMCTGPRP